MNDESDKDNQDDAALFRRAMEGVTPLKRKPGIRRKPAPRKKPVHRHAPAAGEAQPRFSGHPDDQACPDRLYFERAGGARKSVLKRLRAGKLPVESKLDLHGLNVEQARQQLIEFLDECRRFDYRHVLVVHGKGFRSESSPVIKPMVNRWLREASEVLAFCSARPNDGGTGAIYVLLRKTRDEGPG